MNKTLSINLSGQVFQIDEQAYDKLKNYLESIRRRFSVSDGGQDIIADIEARIAELFREKLNDRKQVITLADVDDMMRQMGKPEEFDTAEGTQEAPSGQPRASRRLFRNPDDKIIAGICSGVSAYLGIEDPLWLRLAFVFAVIFSFGSPVLIYIILWLIVPEARTASEKLQMKGESVTIASIEKTIKDDLGDLKNRVQNIQAKDGVRKVREFFERVISMLVDVVSLVFKFILRFTAVLLIITGLLIVLALFFAIAVPAYHDGFTLAALYPLFFGSKTLMFLALLGIILLFAIPALALALLGFYLLLNNRRRIRGLSASLFGLWLLGAGLVIFTAAKTAADFRAADIVRTELPLKQPQNDTLFLAAMEGSLPDNAAEHEFFGMGLFAQADSQYHVSGRVKLDIKKSPVAEFQLTQMVESRGPNRRMAYRKAASVSYKTSQTDSSLMVAGMFSFPVNDRFRGQTVRLIVKVPEGKSVFISESVSYLLDDVQNVTDTRDRDMAGHTWTMLPAGLTCMDCDFAASEQRSSHFPKGKANREFDFSHFNEVFAGGAFDIDIMHGKDFKVSASGTHSFLNNLEISQDGSRLTIRTRHGFRFFKDEDSGTVSVTMPELNRLKITGANRSVVSGFRGNALSLELSGASEAEVKSSFENLEMELTGASSVRLSGIGNELKAVINGASKLRAFEFEAARCDIDVNGASKAEVNVSRELQANASGASEILYKGLPKISSDVTGFSSIKPSK